MEQKQRTNQREFVDNCKESQIILQKDRTDLDCDKQRQTERSVYLNQYSVSNKQVRFGLVWCGDFFTSFIFNFS